MSLTAENSQLTVADAQLLDHFLLNTVSIENAMSLSELHGFVTGLCCSTQNPAPEDWLRWVWDAEYGADEPDFGSIEQAQQITTLIIRLKNETEDALNQNPDEFEPYFTVEPRADDPTLEREVYSDWCAGFLTAIEHYPKGWKKLISAAPSAILPIQLYGSVEGWKTLDDLKYDEETYEQHHDVIAFSAAELYQTAVKLKTNLDRQQLNKVKKLSVDMGDKIGRNDVCPCGSGKKFKLCHGVDNQYYVANSKPTLH